MMEDDGEKFARQKLDIMPHRLNRVDDTGTTW